MADSAVFSPEGDTEPRRRGPQFIFRGPDGLRAGWGALLFILIFVVLYIASGAIVVFLFGLHRPGHLTELTPRMAFIGELLQWIAALGATWAMTRIERRRWADYGFRARHFGRLFVTGWAIGVAALSLLVLLLSAVGVWHYDGVHLHGANAWFYGVIWACLFTMVGVAEESALRGYLLATLTRGISFWPAAVLLSLLFGALHLRNSGEDPFGIVTVIAAGLMLSFVVWRTGSLAMGFGIHAAWDWSQSYLYGTPDSGLHTQGYLMQSHGSGNSLLSGGSAGPEGSVLALPVMVLVALAAMWARKRDTSSAIPQTSQ